MTNTFDPYALLESSQLDGGSLKPHQADAVPWLYARPRAVLADDVGLGKTITAAALISTLAGTGELTGSSCRALWITEASLMGQTATELRRFLPSLGVATSADKAHATTPSAKALREYAERFPNGPDILIVSYQSAVARQATYAALEPALVVLDEAAALDGGSKVFDAVSALTGPAERVLGMSATIAENATGVETFNLLAAVGTPDLWPRKTFEKQFVEWQPAFQMPNGQWVPTQPIGLRPERLPEMREYLARHVLRRTAADAGLKLPSRTGERQRWVPLDWKQQRAYDWAQERFSGLYGHYRRDQAGKLAKDGTSPLVDAALAWLAERPDASKVVIFCEHLDLLDVLMTDLATASIGAVRIDGAKAKQDRSEAVRQFQTDPAIRVLAGSRVLERGLNLQFCRVLLSLGPSYNPGREVQREGRIRRIGSPHETYEHVVFAAETPHERSRAATLDRKSLQRDQLLASA